MPAYALWERSSPLPSFTHLAALARRLPAVGIDVLATLPLYAAFLDEPFDASPYAPASRLHWNEVYLDDAALPVLEPPPQGDLIDWRALARRRRRQLLEASRDLDPFVQHGVDRFVAAFPDVEQYARFRLERAEPSDVGSPRRSWCAAATCSPSSWPTASWPASRARVVPRWPSTCRSVVTSPGSRRGLTASCSPPG